MKKVTITMCSEKDNDFFTILNTTDDLKLFENNKLKYVLDAINENMVSAVYKNDTLIYTKEESSSIYIKKLNINIQTTELSIENYEKVYVLKYINDIPEVVVLRCSREKEEQIVLFDIMERTIVCTLPMAGIFYDLHMDKDRTNIVLLCNYKVENYEMDIFESIHLVHFKRIENQLKVVDAIVFEEESEYYEEENRMKLPLYSYWSYEWPYNKSITASGKYVLYYCNEIRGLVVSHFSNGQVYKMFTLPDICKCYDRYYFNDRTNVLSVINPEGDIEQFYVSDKDSGAEVDLLNRMYNETYIKGSYLKNRFEFNRVFYRIIENTICRKKE